MTNRYRKGYGRSARSRRGECGDVFMGTSGASPVRSKKPSHDVTRETESEGLLDLLIREPSSTTKLFSQTLARCGLFPRLSLTLDIAALRGGLIEDVVRRLDQSCRLKLAQEIACAYQADAFLDDRATLFD